MNKNIIIAALTFSNALLMAALIYVCLRWRPASQTATGARAAAPVPQAMAPTGAQEFAFKTPGRFVGNDAPQIADRALTITAAFDAQEKNGVIVAQGGLAQGYALYLQDGELLFALRRLNVLTTVSGGKLGAGRHEVTAALTKAGELSLAVDGNARVTGRAAGVITTQPVDGLDIGGDRGAPVGPYEIPNSFGGIIEIVTLKTTP